MLHMNVVSTVYFLVTGICLLHLKCRMIDSVLSGIRSSLLQSLLRISGSQMSRHGSFANTNRPNVEIVDIDNTRELCKVSFESFVVKFWRSTFHECSNALLSDFCSCENNQNRKQECAERIRNTPVWSDPNDGASDDNTDRLNNIT